MKPLISKPHLFISYSRKNNDLADYLFKSLSSAGFTVYYDKEKTLVGERFAVQIVKELKRSDAIVAIISSASAQSPWCQAELYHAHALEKMIAPIRIGTELFPVPAPLELLLKEINYVVVSDEATYELAASQVKQQLKGTRRRRHLRNLRNAAALLAIVGVLIIGWRFGIKALNSQARATERNALMERIKGSQALLSRDVIETYAKQFSEDDETISQLLLTQANTELSDNSRLNAQLLSTALLAPRKLHERWYIEDVNWQRSSYENGQLNEITFMKGVMKDVRFKNVSFSGVMWNQAPSTQSAGLMLSDVEFEMCHFEAGRFGGTSGVSVNFINGSFRGTTFDVTGFSAVHFFSRVSDPNSSVITDEVSVFENSSIENCVQPSAPGTIEIVPPDAEVRFTGVVFKDCYFRGLIRPSWFKNCHFINCVFPEKISQSALEAGDNTIENFSTSSADCS